MSLEKRLREAAQSGEFVRVIYEAGSTPGRPRDILPLVVTEIEVSARESGARATKTYFLHKMRLCDPNIDLATWEPAIKPIASIEEIAKRYRAEMQALGWHVETDARSFCLHVRFKNGKIKKKAVLGISERDKDPEDDRPLSRPYYLWAPDFAQLRTFKDLTAAMEPFLNQANAHAPISIPEKQNI